MLENMKYEYNQGENMRTALLLFAPLLLTAEMNLDDINVSASTEKISEEEMDFVVQKESFMENAPMQKQITIKQALGIAGTNGDPIKALKSFAGVVSTNNDEG